MAAERRRESVLRKEAAVSLNALPSLETIYDTIPIGLAFLTPDCRYLQINQRMTEICGLSVEDHLGRTVRETLPRLADQVEDAVRHIVSTGESITGIEVSGEQSDSGGGTRFWVTSWQPLKDESGKVLGVNVAAEEITQRKRVEAALVASEARLRELNETLEQRVEAQARERNRIWNVSHELLLVTDKEGRFLSVNPAWTTTLGWLEDELVGQTVDRFVHADDREKSNVYVQLLAAGQGVLTFESRFRRRDGSYRWLSWTAVADQELNYAVARDTTELKEAEKEVLESRTELARVARETMMGAMTASIAHEINQPLAAIVTNGGAGLRWLSGDTPNLDEARDVLNRMVDDARRASQIIAGVRAMFTKDAGELAPLDINDVVRDVLLLVHGELQGQHVAEHINLFGHPLMVRGNRVQLQQVLLNLFMNAIEAMSSVNDRPRTISVNSVLQETEGVLLTVGDSGPGINPADIDRVFDAFFTSKPTGMGMGLAICRSIIESHGGRLWASPGSPGGAAFHVSLPLSEPQARTHKH